MLFDGVGEWTKHWYHFFSLNRSGPRQKDGCTIAVSTKFPHTQIRCVHHWMPGRIISLRLQCGVEMYAGDVYFISAYAPIHDEQTSISVALRIELWSKLDGVIRQVPNRCRVILCMDANGEVDTTLLGSDVQAAEFVIGEKMYQNDQELLELSRSNQLVAISTHGEANRPSTAWIT